MRCSSTSERKILRQRAARHAACRRFAASLSPPPSPPSRLATSNSCSEAGGDGGGESEADESEAEEREYDVRNETDGTRLCVSSSSAVHIIVRLREGTAHAVAWAAAQVEHERVSEPAKGTATLSRRGVDDPLRPCNFSSCSLRARNLCPSFRSRRVASSRSMMPSTRIPITSPYGKGMAFRSG